MPLYVFENMDRKRLQAEWEEYGRPMGGAIAILDENMEL